MKKKSTSTKHIKPLEFMEVFHNYFEMAADQLDKHELDSYIDENNLPDIKRLEEDDNITVADVLVIGSFLPLSYLHEYMHPRNEVEEHVETEVRIMSVKNGKSKEVTIDEVPEEVREALNEILKKGKRRDTKKS